MSNIYSQLKILHFKEKIDSLPKKVNEIRAPIHVRIKPTNVCNHNCWYCAYRAKTQKLGEDMNIKDYIPKSKMVEIISDLDSMGVKAVTFSGGGEPFCYPYLAKAVQNLIKSNIKFASLTNGSKLSGEIAELFAHNASWLRVSMDACNDEDYSKQRSVKYGEFLKIIKNIKNFQKLNGRCFLGVSLIVNKKNYEGIYDFIKLLKDIGVHSVKIAPCIISNDGLENNNYHKYIYNKVKEQTSLAISNLSEEYFEIFDSYHTQLESFKKNYDWCPYQQILPIIGADLNIYSCQDKAYTKSGRIGTIKTKRFKDFWNSNKSKFFKINPRKQCNHHCVAASKNKLIMEYLNVDKQHIDFV